MAKSRDFVNLILQFCGFFLFIQPSQAAASTSNLGIKPTYTRRGKLPQSRNLPHIPNKKRDHFYSSKNEKSRPARPLKNAKTKKMIKIKKTLDFSTA